MQVPEALWNLCDIIHFSSRLDMMHESCFATVAATSLSSVRIRPTTRWVVGGLVVGATWEEGESEKLGSQYSPELRSQPSRKLDKVLNSRAAVTG